jgi:protein-tyrosine phosphatase
MAEVILRHRLLAAGRTDVQVESTGLGPWHVGEPMDARARRALKERGYDGSGHRARQLDHDDLERADLVLAMDRSNLASLRRMAPDDERVRLFGSYLPGEPEVPDPYYDGGFDAALDLIEAAADALVRRLEV